MRVVDTALGIVAHAVLLLVAANATPLVIGWIFGPRGAAPLDLGITLPDGQRLLGAHKTWRGLVAGTLACGLAASLTGAGLGLGLGFGALSLVGDALSSAAKRRLRLPAGRDVVLLDQLPEALLPLLAYSRALGIHAGGIAVATLVFTVLDILSSFERPRYPRQPRIPG